MSLEKLDMLLKTEQGRKTVSHALEKTMLKPKRPLSFWEYKFHKFMIRMGRRVRNDNNPHAPCKRCDKQILSGLQIPLCKECYEQSERDYLTQGNLTRLEGDQSELIKGDN